MKVSIEKVENGFIIESDRSFMAKFYGYAIENRCVFTDLDEVIDYLKQKFKPPESN